MIDALADRMGRMIATPRGFTIFASLCIGAVFLARAVPFPGSSDDTAELLLHSQYFAWGYELKNPPLMSWLVIAAQQLFGVSLSGRRRLGRCKPSPSLWSMGRRVSSGWVSS